MEIRITLVAESNSTNFGLDIRSFELVQ